MFTVKNCYCCDALAICVHDKYDNLDVCWRCIEGSALWRSLSHDGRTDLREDYEQALKRKDFQRELAVT